MHVPDDHSFISNGLISHNSYILALYCMLRALFEQGRRIVIVGAAFRQAKVVFDYCHELWEDSPVLRSLVGPSKHNGPRRDVDRCSMRLGDSLIVGLPIGDGSKIRGQRASIVVSDEFASLNPEIFETVIRGFGAVSMNPVDKMVDEYGKLALQELGLWNEGQGDISQARLTSNQTIISGTAYYAFNHFYSYWKRYKSIIESRGDQQKLEQIFNGKVPTDFDWRDYSIIRVPFDRLPRGFMDSKQIAQAKATVSIGTFTMEYGATFSADSNGFFKRSLIESCVVGKPTTPISHPSCGEVRFNATLMGDLKKEHVIAIDPASERDNCSVVVLELWPDHRRIVHCWTTRRDRYKAKLKRGLTDEQDFYAYVARKIRELKRLFPAARIAVDSQGGGHAVVEALQAKDRLKSGERPLYPVVDPEDPKETDNLSGEHILEIINFAKADWVRDANHGLKKDLEDKALLFPEFNSAVLGLALEEDKAAKRVLVDAEDRMVEKLAETLDDCMMEIEELKDELATIVMTQTGSTLRDRWDTPETKMEGGKKGRLRKDRYSSLLMANMVARVYQSAPKQGEYRPVGGFAHIVAKEAASNKEKPRQGMWIGPAWWVDKVNSSSYGAVVRRR